MKILQKQMGRLPLSQSGKGARVFVRRKRLLRQEEGVRELFAQ